MIRLSRTLLDSSSEIKLQRELNLPRRSRRQGISEAALTKFQRRRLGADRAKLPKQIIHMVENIEKFRAEFELLLFFDRKLFGQCGVPLCISGALDDVASGVAECPQVRVVGERASVEERAGDTGLGVGITNQVGARAIVANGSTAIATGNIIDISGSVVIAGCPGKDARHLPVAENLIHDARRVPSKHSSAAEGQIIDIAENETLPDVEVGVAVVLVGIALVLEIPVVH